MLEIVNPPRITTINAKAQQPNAASLASASISSPVGGAWRAVPAITLITRATRNPQTQVFKAQEPENPELPG